MIPASAIPKRRLRQVEGGDQPLDLYVATYYVNDRDQYLRHVQGVLAESWALVTRAEAEGDDP